MNVQVNQESVSEEEFRERKRRRIKEEIAKIFQSNGTGNERIQAIISKIKPLLSDEQFSGITPALQSLSSIEDEGEFVESVFLVLQPVLELKKRVTIAQRHGFVELNDVLSYGMGEDLVHIHAESFRKRPTQDGLQKLAEIVNKNENVRYIIATSWIVSKKPEWLEELGFTDMGPITEEEREKHFKDDTRPINRAVMSREDFLKRYLKKEEGKLE